MNTNIDIGDTICIKVGYNNRYHDINGDKVLIIGECYHKKERVLTFYHPQKGFGAMYGHGFEYVDTKNNSY